MEKKTRKIDLNNILFPLFWAFILVLCVFVLKSTAKAVTIGEMPFKFSDITLYNTWGNNDNLGNDILSSIDNYGLPVYDNDYVLIVRDVQFYAMEAHPPLMYVIYRAYFWLVPIDVYTSYYDNFATNTFNFNTLSNTDSYFFGVHFDINGNNFTPIVFNVSTNPNYSETMFGSVPRPYTNNNATYPVEFTYTINAPYYFSKDFFYQNQYVLDYTGGSQNVVHGAVPNIVSQKITNPNNTPVTKPQPPTIISYTWNTYNPPSFDDSSILDAIESVGEMISYTVSYLAEGIKGEFTAITTNIGSYATYIVQSVEAGLNSIIQAIQDFSDSIYNNFKSLFEPMFEKIEGIQEKLEEFADLFIHPFDSEEFEQQIEDSSFFTNYHAIVDNCEVLEEIIDYAEEREHFSLYISFENPLDNSVHRIISSEISFDWLVPLRSIYRPFLWVCVLIELFVGGARVLTHALGGHGV